MLLKREANLQSDFVPRVQLELGPAEGEAARVGHPGVERERRSAAAVVQGSHVARHGLLPVGGQLAHEAGGRRVVLRSQSAVFAVGRAVVVASRHFSCIFLGGAGV